MKKIYLDNLPRKNINIDWKKCIGYMCEFTYDNIKGNVKIIGYDNSIVKFVYNGNIFSKNTGSFTRCSFGDVVNKRNIDYLYNVGDIIYQQKILTKTRNSRARSYTVKCTKCGITTQNKLESDIVAGKGCPVCSNKKVVYGVNDITTTHPHLVKYFANIEDAKTNTYGKNKSVYFKCNICGNIESRAIYHVTKRGFNCKKCGDGVSFPNKLMLNVLSQINVNFKNEKKFYWSNNKIYDFVIFENIIIEVHGGQHYREAFSSVNGRTLEEEQENDKLKEELARENGISHYIVLDCRYSELEWIKNSIMNSELPDLLNFKEEDVDWLECERFAMSSRLKEACDLWNNGTRSAIEISKIMHIHHHTAWEYLKSGAEINLCDYDAKKALKNGGYKAGKSLAKRISMYKDNKFIGEFESASWIDRNSVEMFGLKLDFSRICATCRGELKHYKGYTFKYAT